MRGCVSFCVSWECTPLRCVARCCERPLLRSPHKHRGFRAGAFWRIMLRSGRKAFSGRRSTNELPRQFRNADILESVSSRVKPRHIPLSWQAKGPRATCKRAALSFSWLDRVICPGRSMAGLWNDRFDLVGIRAFLAARIHRGHHVVVCGARRHTSICVLGCIGRRRIDP